MNKNTFYDLSINDVKFVPFDIETTGLYDTDVITSFTLEHNQEYISWLNSNGETIDSSIESELRQESGADVSVHSCTNEGDILSSVGEYLNDNFNKDSTLLIAYNGEVWKGGFDISFIRSACLRTGEEFPFIGFTYVDLMPIFGKKDRFNVKHPVEEPELENIFYKDGLKSFADALGVEYSSNWNKSEIATAIEDVGYSEDQLHDFCEENGDDMPDENPQKLVPVYQRVSNIAGWDVNDFDPFEPDESIKAVRAFEENEFKTLLLHNVADVHKTSKLVEVVQSSRSIPLSEFSPTFF